MKIAILGGSFNPLHNGHAMLADTIIKELGFDKVLFIPTCVPPHKELAGGTTTQQRLNIVKAFCDSEKSGCFELETCEIDRGGVSYTYDTLSYVQEKYKGQLEGKPALIMGEEIAAEFHKWKNADKVAEMSDLIIVPRYPDYFGHCVDAYKNKPSDHYKGDFNLKFERNKFLYTHRYLGIPMLPISSTEIRARIASGKSFKYLIPESVFNYIEKHGIYGYSSGNVK